MIKSWGDSATEDLFNGVKSAKVRAFDQDAVKPARKKLDTLNAAADLGVLAAVPGNRLELLKGGRFAGFYSVRVNNKWRIVFKWTDGPCDVRLVDYHD
ncbi:MAG TPA: type II toxin-antitoxin system RelE/ParE family toxin [Casimicrobiaceae bacterium]|nr:type II toxin-antitoxin system RelE/ParE family toxin [Casimicrobiaceae bacterium]